VAELVTTLRRADSLLGQLRAKSQPEPQRDPRPQLQPGPPVTVPQASASAPTPIPIPARAWFTGKSVGVILLILGALCVLAAGAVFVAVTWVQLPLAVRTLILVTITATFGLFAQLSLRRGLTATAEAMAMIATGMFVLDLAAARSAGFLRGLGAAPYMVLSGLLIIAVAGAAVLAVRSQQHWLWSLDAAVALGTSGVATGGLRLVRDAGDGADGYAVSFVSLTVVLSLLYALWRRASLPVAMWSTALMGALTWLAALAVGAQRAGDYVGAGHIGDDVARMAAAWPALAMALVAGIWSIRLTHAVWRRVAACLCLLPVLLVLEIIGWSHDAVVGTVVMLLGYVAAALASRRVPSTWSPAAGGSAVVLALSAVAGLIPTMSELATRLGQAPLGRWVGSDGLPLGPSIENVAPWLLPLATVVVLGLLPQVTLGRHRLSLHWHYSAGAFVATLAVQPILFGAGFWMSITVLFLLAVVVLGAASLWRHDSLLVLAVVLLAVMRVCAYYDRLADPLAWTLIAMVGLAWSLTERRPAVAAAFLAGAGLSALLGAAQWLIFAQWPPPFQALVIVVIGSLGLLAAQRTPATTLTRHVAEGLSMTWMVVGLAMADRSPSHRALELTVAGVAAGITGYLSQDRRRAGWVSGALLTAASWIRLTDSDVQIVEWYTLPAATALLVYGTARLRRDPTDSTWRTLGPGLALALTPSLLSALDEPVSWRGLVVGLASVAMLALGAGLRLAAPFGLGAAGTGLLVLRHFWPLAAFVPRWTLLFVLGGVLLATGMTWETRVNDVRTAGRYVRGLR
jgi:hypothetical protein